MKSLLCLLALFVAPAQAQDWKLDPAQSQIRFVIRQMNVPVEGGFRRFQVKANFDPARIDSARFEVDVDVASIDTGSEEGDSEARRPVWFDTQRHPRARFVSKSVRKETDGRHSVLGDLTIKGTTRPLAVSVDLVRQPKGGWLAQGRFPLKRSDFNIGAGEWNDVVSDVADVRFKIVLAP
jgi:polyisoprenoid-binding protein YceI